MTDGRRPVIESVGRHTDVIGMEFIATTSREGDTVRVTGDVGHHTDVNGNDFVTVPMDGQAQPYAYGKDLRQTMLDGIVIVVPYTCTATLLHVMTMFPASPEQCTSRAYGVAVGYTGDIRSLELLPTTCLLHIPHVVAKLSADENPPGIDATQLPILKQLGAKFPSPP